MFKANWQKKGLLLGAAIAAMLLVAAACGGGAGATPTPTPPPATPTATRPPVATATATRAPVATPTPTAVPPTPTPTPKFQPKKGGSLRFAQTSDPPTFDVHATSFSLLTDHTRLTHSRVLRYKALGWPEEAKYGELTVVGDLAEKWEVSNGGKTFTFHLRPGVKWPNVAPLNGRELTSEDAKKAYERILNAPKSIFKDFYKAITSMSTPDKYTFVMTIDKPLASWLFRVADGEAAWITAQDFIDAKGADYGVRQDSLVGTGPFLIKSEEPGARYVYTRNPSYFLPNLPYIDEVVRLIIKDASAREAAFVSGQIDNLGASRTSVPRIQKALPKATLDSNPGLSNTASGIMFNMTNPKWQDIRVRQAIQKGVDQARIIADLYGGQGRYQGCMPTALSTFALSQDELKTLYKYDPDGAKALLAAAGLSTGFTFEMTTFTGYQQRLLDIAELAQDDLKKIGVTMVLKPVPVASGRPAVEAGNFESVIQPHSTGVEPDEMLGGFTTGGGRNFMRVSDPKVDAWDLQQSVEFDVKKRAAITQEFSRYCAQQVLGLIPIPNEATFAFSQEWVKNFSISDVASDEPRELFAWIEK